MIAELFVQVLGEASDRVRPEPAAVEPRVEVDVDPRVPVVGLVLGAVLDEPRDAPVGDDRETRRLGLVEREVVVLSAPPLRDFGVPHQFGQDARVVVPNRTQRDDLAFDLRHANDTRRPIRSRPRRVDRQPCAA